VGALAISQEGQFSPFHLDSTDVTGADSQASSHVASLFMVKSKLSAREKSRQEQERAKSTEGRSRQLMKKAAQLQQKAEHANIRQAAARIAKQVVETK
jgi:hypothetical protein